VPHRRDENRKWRANSGKPGLTVSGKTAAILLALTTGGEPSLSTLAHHTRLSVSTVYRLLHDLAASAGCGAHSRRAIPSRGTRCAG
jgi:DNA-binding MarR family transcriptional regulator